MDLREALIKRKVRDEMKENYERTAQVQKRLKCLPCDALEQLQALMNNKKYLGAGSWCVWIEELITKVEGQG